MTITVPAIPTPVPTSTDPTNFDARADALLAALPGFVEGQNLQNVENNTININVNDKAIDTAADAVATGQDRTQTALDRAAAAASYDAFDDRYLGSKTSDPTVDNDGNALLEGALYWNSGAQQMRVRGTSAWIASYVREAFYAPIDSPAFTGSITGGTGVVNLGSGQFYKDANGNVGIGTSSPAAKLTVIQGSVSISGVNSGSGILQLGDPTDTTPFVGVYRAAAAAIATGGNFLNLGGYDGIAFTTGQTALSTQVERVRIDSSGSLLVGTASAVFSGYKVSIVGGTSGVGGIAWRNNDTVQSPALVFANSISTVVGSISVSNTATLYNTSSDYRLKNTIAPMTGALDKLALLKPCTYKWNADGSDGQGFIAHELAEVEPGCVSGEKDATETRTVETSPAIHAVLNEDGVETSPAVAAVTEEQTFPKYQGIDTSFLVATLTAALQEAHGLIKNLEQRMAAMEAK